MAKNWTRKKDNNRHWGCGEGGFILLGLFIKYISYHQVYRILDWAFLRNVVFGGLLHLVLSLIIEKIFLKKSYFFNFFYSSGTIFCSAMQKSLYQCKLKLPDFYKLTKNQISKCQLMSQWKSKRKFFTSMVNLKIFPMEIRQKFKVFRFSTMRFWWKISIEFLLYDRFLFFGFISWVSYTNVN